MLLGEMHGWWVWNQGRALHEQTWRQERRTVSCAELCRALTGWRAEHEWLREGSADAQQQALRELCAAYARAFTAWRRRGCRGTLALPGFRSRRRPGWRTVRLTRNGHRLRDGLLHLAGIPDGLEVRWSRALPSVPASVTVTLDSSGRWHASFRVEAEPQPLAAAASMAGVDLGVSCAYALSDGHREPNPRHLRRRQRGFAEFRRLLAYQAILYTRELRVIDRFHPSSKTCSDCGHAKAKLALSERTYHCERCSLVLDRDVNAARNILAAGLAESQNACEGRIRPARPRPRGQRPQKQEAPLATARIPRL